jgi:hypothetical protein
MFQERQSTRYLKRENKYNHYQLHPHPQVGKSQRRRERVTMRMIEYLQSIKYLPPTTNLKSYQK